MTPATTQRSRSERTPGEQAFDRCFFPFIALVVLSAAIATLAADDHDRVRVLTEAELDAQSPSAFGNWIYFAVGVISAVFWARALASLLRAWSDPSARVLRFSALGILSFFATTVCSYLRAPF